MSRRAKVNLLSIGIVAIVGMTFFWFWFLDPMLQHGRWYNRVRDDMKALTHKRPPEVSKGQWEFAVGWTINLHGNCGSINSLTSLNSTADANWRDKFATELERRLAGSMTIADIEWIWDEYVRNTTHGATYSEKWRPTKAEEFPQVSVGCFGIHVD